MNCPVCKNGCTSDGTTTVTLETKGHTVVLKSVPARVCDNCGEAYVDQTTAENLLRRAESAVASGVEVEIVRYAAA